MRLSWYFLFFVGLVAGFETLELEDENSYQWLACASAITEKATFCEKTRRRRLYACFCQNKQALASLMGCYEILGKRNPASLAYVIEECQEYNVTLSQANFIELYSHFVDSATAPEEHQQPEKPVRLPEEDIRR